MKQLSDLSLFEKPSSHLSHDQWLDSGRDQFTEFCKAGPDLSAHQSLQCTILCRSDLQSYRHVRGKYLCHLGVQYVRSGCLAIRNGDKGFLVEAGEVCFLQPFQEHEILYDFEEPTYTVGIGIGGGLLPYVLKTLNLEKEDVIRLNDSARFEELYESLRETMLNGVSLRMQERNCGCCLELLQVLANEVHAEPVPPLVFEMCEFIEQHCSEDIGIPTLTRRFNLCRSVLSSRFVQAMKCTPYQYLIKVRMSRARFMLQERQLSIKEIAHAVGYSNQLHFSHEFKRCFGCPPSAMRP